MVVFLVLFIVCLCAVHVVSECKETFLFDKIYVDSKPTYYFDLTTLDSKLVCSKKCQENKYCTGFSYNLSNGRCELYDQVISTAQTEVAAGTMTYAVNKVCGPPPSIPNTNTQPSYPDFLPGHLMLYDCLPNTYQNTSIVCLNDGTWTTPAVSCQYVKTCDDAASLGVAVGSDLVVKPIETSSTVVVKCEYNGGNYWTVIDTTWDNNTKLEGYEAKQSGVYDVNYSINIHYISAIADLSTFCTQYMKVICLNSNLMRDNGWRTRDGSLADYFFGGIKGQLNCACDLNSSCYDNLKCNCNADDYTERQDEGFSTYKDDLPVTAFLNGDTGNSGEYYYLHISSLRCKGISPSP